MQFTKRRYTQTKPYSNEIIYDYETEAGWYEDKNGKSYYWTQDMIDYYRRMQTFEEIQKTLSELSI